MNAALFDRWTKTWAELGRRPPVELFGHLVTQYCGRERAYHSIRHLTECLDALDRFPEASPEAALALWFHDSVYDVRSSGSEVRSAELAGARLEAEGIGPDSIRRVQDLVLATCHGATPESQDGRIVVDCDLAILGAKWDRFSEYERQVRREYAHVPDDAFRLGRARILRGFLDRPSVFSTDRFRLELGPAARRNLFRSLAALEAKVEPGA